MLLASCGYRTIFCCSSPIALLLAFAHSTALSSLGSSRRRSLPQSTNPQRRRLFIDSSLCSSVDAGGIHDPFEIDLPDAPHLVGCPVLLPKSFEQIPRQKATDRPFVGLSNPPQPPKAGGSIISGVLHTLIVDLCRGVLLLLLLQAFLRQSVFELKAASIAK